MSSSRKAFRSRSTKVVDPGLFHAKYVAYVVNTRSEGVTVERRYSEFDALRSELLKCCPGASIVPLPKKAFARSTESNFVQARKNAVQKFLDSVFSNSAVRSNEILKAFLTLPNKEWEVKARNYGKTLGSGKTTPTSK